MDVDPRTVSTAGAKKGAAAKQKAVVRIEGLFTRNRCSSDVEPCVTGIGPWRGERQNDGSSWSQHTAPRSRGIQTTPPACLNAIKPLPGMDKDLRTDENYREESIDKATSEDRRMAWGELTTYGLMSY